MDHLDIGIHGAIALVGTYLVGYWNRWVALAINTIIWPLREVIQHNGLPTSMQSTLEWAVPVALGCVVFSLYGLKRNG